jgi:amino acid permease
MKKHIALPLSLLIYLGAMAYFFYPDENSQSNYTQYYISIGVTLGVIIALFFFLKKKEKIQDKRRQK